MQDQSPTQWLLLPLRHPKVPDAEAIVKTWANREPSPAFFFSLALPHVPWGRGYEHLEGPSAPPLEGKEICLCKVGH